MSRIMTFISVTVRRSKCKAKCNPTSFLTVKLVLSYKSLLHEMSRTMKFIHRWNVKSENRRSYDESF
jgi:hypothetical protein